MDVYLAQLDDAELAKNDPVCTFEPIVCGIEQQSCHDNNDRRADHKKDSAHKRGIQKSQTEPKRHGSSKYIVSG